MSYILDALKKAERERRLAKAPAIDAIHDIPGRNRLSRWIAAGMFSLCIIAALGLAYLKTQKSGIKYVASSAPPALKTPQQAAAAPSGEVSGKLPNSESKEPAAGTPLRTAERFLHDAKIEPSAPAVSGITIGSASSDQPVLTELVQSHARKGAASSAAIEKPAESFQDSAALFHISIHVYADAKEDRLVFINGKSFHEGDYLEPDIYLEKITPEGAILRSGEKQLVLRPGSR